MALRAKFANSTMTDNIISILGMSTKNESSSSEEFRGHILLCSVACPKCESVFVSFYPFLRFS